MNQQVTVSALSCIPKIMKEPECRDERNFLQGERVAQPDFARVIGDMKSMLDGDLTRTA